LRRGGTAVAYGFYQASNLGSSVVLDVLMQYVLIALRSIPPGRRHVAFYDIRSAKKKHPDWFEQDLTMLFSLLAAAKVRPVIAGRLPLKDAVKAHQQVEAADVQGKLILIPNP
jgi:NADPH:quinone reductase-like Zn-dependent oxidoreductase